MKLGTLKQGGRDGSLVAVSRDLSRYIEVPQIAGSLREAIEDWSTKRAALQNIYDDLNNDLNLGHTFDVKKFAAPMPRVFQWLDGSAYLSHMRLVRQARGADMPDSFLTDPLMYQGAGDTFLGPVDDIPCINVDWGLDFESEIVVVTDDVAAGSSATDAKDKILLVGICNDLSLRNLIPDELGKNFGFLQSKPSSAFSPVFVTPDELGDAWDGGKINLPLQTWYNGERFGEVEAGRDLAFEFPALISHAVKTRGAGAGTIIGSGTVSNEDYANVGSSCLAEKRMIEILNQDAAKTPFMTPGDTIRIEMFDNSGQSIFGAISQKVVAY